MYSLQVESALFVKLILRRTCCRHGVLQVWQSLFSVRSLVIPMHEDVDNWIKFASLCRKSGRPRQSERMLINLLGYDPRSIAAPGTPSYGAGR